MLTNVIGKFEKIVSIVLLIVAMLIASFQTLELIYEFSTALISRVRLSGFKYVPEYSQNVVVLFFNVLLTLEVMETIKVFRQSHEAKIQIIFIVVMIAISRKVFTIDLHTAHAEEIFAVAALMLVFSLAYFLVRKTNGIKSIENAALEQE